MHVTAMYYSYTLHLCVIYKCNSDILQLCVTANDHCMLTTSYSYMSQIQMCDRVLQRYSFYHLHLRVTSSCFSYTLPLHIVDIHCNSTLQPYDAITLGNFS